jgi:flagellar biosynthesis protein FlgN
LSPPDSQTLASGTHDLAAFVASLDRAIEDMRQLAEFMLEELRAITSRDLDGLQRSVSEKQRLLARLEAETARQRDWIEAAGFSFTPDGVERFIQTQDQDEQLGTRWSALLDHTRRCDQLNSDNARSIERDQRRIAMTLRLLKGEDASTTTYDPRGRTAASGQRGRTISQA